MNTIKMIVTDLDETLLRTDKTLSAYTVNVLRRCRASGVKLAYATGRGGSSVFIVPAEYFDGRISVNGALAYAGDICVYDRLIPWRTARPLLTACDRRGLKTATQNGGMDYANFIMSDVWPWLTHFKVVDLASHQLDAEKICAVVESSKDAVFIEENLPPPLYLTVSRDNLAMVMDKDATKSKAVSALANYWGIAMENVAAFGDDLNDIDMLERAGIGIAMGNATEAVKTVADHVCLDNDDDGLAKWIVKNLLD